MAAVKRGQSEGVHLSFDSWLKLLTFALTVGSMIGGPMIFACFEIRDAVGSAKRTAEIIERHVDEAKEEFREARDDRRQMDRRIYVLERTGG